jgi:hypothetical protein
VGKRIRTLHHGRIDDGQCVTWMILRFAVVWFSEEVAKILATYPIHHRDGWTRPAPRCRNVGQIEDHQVIHLGRGGPRKDPSNRTTQCWPNHHAGIHAGWVVVEAKAPHDLIFHVGGGKWRTSYRNEIRLPRPGSEPPP